MIGQFSSYTLLRIEQPYNRDTQQRDGTRWFLVNWAEKPQARREMQVRLREQEAGFRSYLRCFGRLRGLMGYSGLEGASYFEKKHMLISVQASMVYRFSKFLMFFRRAESQETIPFQ